MTSLISAALIIVALESGPLPRCQTLANPRELTIQTAVEDHAADLGDEPPQEALVHALVEHDRPVPERPPETCRERGAVRGGERHRGADARSRPAEGRVDQPCVGRRDLPQVVRPPAHGEQRDEVPHQRRDRELGRDGGDELPPHRGGAPRPRQELAEARVRPERLDYDPELLANRLRATLLLGQRKERLRVALGGRLAAPHEGRPSSERTASATIRRWSSSRRLFRISFSATAVARSPTSRRSSSRARRTSASSWARAPSTRRWASARAASMSLRCSSAASFRAASRMVCASA